MFSKIWPSLAAAAPDDDATPPVSSIYLLITFLWSHKKYTHKAMLENNAAIKLHITGSAVLPGVWWRKAIAHLPG